MNVAYIAAGAAGMYCGSCLHDNTLAAAMIREGHDVSLIPTYTPIRTDEEDVSTGQVFYGAINVYLEQKTSLFRHTPWLVDRMLNNPRLLEWVGKKGAGSTDARVLGELTLSVLQGEHGKQSKELERLVSWLRDDLRPDIVVLTNAMFAGMTRRFHEELGVPVVCALQGEDIFLDDLQEPYKTRVLETMRERARDIDGFIANTAYYAEAMAETLDVPRDLIDRVPLGIKLEGHHPPAERDEERPFTVGYLARICPEKGLHLLLEAFKKLVDRPGGAGARLRVAGYLGARDHAYHQGLVEQVAEWGLNESIDMVGEIDRNEKIAFLHSVDVLSVPTVYREPKGLFVLEALANGIPVVQPNHGAFPEVVEETGGGVLFEPGNVDALADTLESLASDPKRREELGAQGLEGVRRNRDDTTMARRTLAVFDKVIDRYRASAVVEEKGA